MKLRKKILFGLGAVVVAMQFFRPSKNIARDPSSDGSKIGQFFAPQDVQNILQAACYDCHSGSTRYPWYAEIEPVGWWLADHVIDGKAVLDFSNFRALSAREASRLLDACVDAINHDTMPPASYRLMHADARLSNEQKTLLTAWLQDVSEKISTGK